MSEEIPFGYCQCGCGKLAPIARMTRTEKGIKKGEPTRYITGHNNGPYREITTGERFGRLVVISQSNTTVDCMCDCGKTKQVLRGNLLKGRSRSCGCLSRELSSARLYQHGAAREGRVTKTFSIWQGMKDRCNNLKNPKYSDYGGRGITVCDRWLKSFENFLADMGGRPDGLSIDRINNDGNYEPANCRWATSLQQGRNKRNNRLVTIGYRTQPLSAWVDELGLNIITVYSRIKSGLSAKEALLMKKGAPIKKRGPYKTRKSSVPLP